MKKWDPVLHKTWRRIVLIQQNRGRPNISRITIDAKRFGVKASSPSYRCIRPGLGPAAFSPPVSVDEASLPFFSVL